MHRAPDHVSVQRVGRHPAAGPVGGFQHEDVHAGLLKPKGSGEAGDARADDHPHASPPIGRS